MQSYPESLVVVPGHGCEGGMVTLLHALEPSIKFVQKRKKRPVSHYYIHGTHPSEQERLQRLNELVNPAYLEFVELHPGEHLLDAGAGLGILAAALAERHPESRVTGLEYFPEQIAACPQKLPNMKMVQGDAMEMPFPDESFETVSCRFLLEHVPVPEQVLTEIFRVLKPGGRVYLQENANLVAEFYPPCTVFKKVWKAFYEYQSGLGGDGMIGLRLFPLLRQAGFSCIELSIAPEIHMFGSRPFDLWITNLIGNLEGVRISFGNSGYTSMSEFEEAIGELEALLKNPEASSFFYWNRARGIKLDKLDY